MLLRWLFIILLFVGCTDARDEARSDARGAVDPGADATTPSLGIAPAIEGESLQGQWVDTERLRGQVLVVNFWATWCGPCREEIPTLSRLHREYRDRGVRVIGVSIDTEGAAVVQSFLNTYDVDYPVLLDAESEVARAYGGHYAVPTTFVVDPAGRIRHRFMRVVTRSDLLAAVGPLLPDGGTASWQPSAPITGRP